MNKFIPVLIAMAIPACAVAPAPRGSGADHPLAEIRSVRVVASLEPLNLQIDVDAMAPTPGFTALTLRPVTYIQRPPDGIYDVTAVGRPPVAIVPAVLDPVRFTYRWTGFPEDLRGVRVHASGNAVEAMLPGR
jgi:hypothetical protein